MTETPAKDLTADNLAKYDVLLLNYKDTTKGGTGRRSWSDDNKKAFADAVQGGKGLVVYHHASSAFVGDSEFDKEFEKVIAGGWRKQGNHGKRHEFTRDDPQGRPPDHQGAAGGVRTTPTTSCTRTR